MWMRFQFFCEFESFILIVSLCWSLIFGVMRFHYRLTMRHSLTLVFRLHVCDFGSFNGVGVNLCLRLWFSWCFLVCCYCFQVLLSICWHTKSFFIPAGCHECNWWRLHNVDYLELELEDTGGYISVHYLSSVQPCASVSFPAILCYSQSSNDSQKYLAKKDYKLNMKAKNLKTSF